MTSTCCAGRDERIDMQGSQRNVPGRAVPTSAGPYKLHVADGQGNKLGESAVALRVN